MKNNIPSPPKVRIKIFRDIPFPPETPPDQWNDFAEIIKRRNNYEKN